MVDALHRLNIHSQSRPIVREAKPSTIISLLDREIKEAVSLAFGPDYHNISAPIGPSKLSDGDYQTTVALQLSKVLKLPPKEVSTKILSSIQLGPVIGFAEISGPGFINLYLSDHQIRRRLLGKLVDPERLGISKFRTSEKVVVDFSSPNIAKEMHVGHLRSTIIGDCISRVHEFLGNEVLRLNHVGDWGTQFGMLIHYMKTTSNDLSSTSIGNLVQFYQKAKREFDSDLVFQEASRLEVVRLQSGDAEALRAWRVICEKSREEFQQIYDLLNVSIVERGESFYNPMLPSLVKSLLETGIAEESEQATVIFLEGFRGSDGNRLPLIVRKSDGGYLYATTDLAALQHRISVEKARRIIYITDAGQAQHFQMVFDAARKAKILDDNDVKVSHLSFGLVLGADGKKIKTRSGESVKLKELLEEAIDRAKAEFLSRSIARGEETIVEERQVSDSDIAAKARTMGIAAVKYADLSMNRESNYRFSFDKMLSLQGNTAPYMLYAYVRIRGIQRKVLPLLSVSMSQDHDSDLLLRQIFGQFREGDFVLDEVTEQNLAKHLLKSDDILYDVADQLLPNKLCDYLFELSQKFNQFYESCPVVKASDERSMKSRLALCTITANTIRLYLHLLGIETVETI